jgi:spore coat protein CotH
MTSIPNKIGIALIMVYWLSMAGMVANAYFYYNYDVLSVNSNEV